MNAHEIRAGENGGVVSRLRHLDPQRVPKKGDAAEDRADSYPPLSIITTGQPHQTGQFFNYWMTALHSKRLRVPQMSPEVP